MAIHNPNNDKSIDELQEDTVFDGTEKIITSDGKFIPASLFVGQNGVNQVGHVFASIADRNAYSNAYDTMIALEVDTGTFSMRDGTSWVEYTDALPAIWFGAVPVADVTGHLPDGKRYTEEA